MVIDGPKALANLANNPEGRWTGWGAADPASRIFYDTAKVRFDYAGPRLAASDGVFAMGSCFAREIERQLAASGRNVLSAGSQLTGPAFEDAKGALRDDFLNRFTPVSMLQEFQAAFGELQGWSDEALTFAQGLGRLIDFNYWLVPGADTSRRATLARRRQALQLARRAAEARMVILTLGLIEAWRHKPSGLWANSIAPAVLARRPNEFELVVLDVATVVESLEAIRELLKRVRRAGEVELVVTVSPIPMQATFTGQDVLIANAESKAVLRVAAAEFTRRHADAHYFPSYELVTLSNPARTWKPDGIHIGGRTVDAVTELFVSQVYGDTQGRLTA